MKFTHALKHSAVRSGLLAGLMAAAFCGQAQAAAYSTSIITGGTAANYKAYGSTFSGPADNTTDGSNVTAMDFSNAVNPVFENFTLTETTDLTAFGSWQNNSGNAGTNPLYFGIFQVLSGAVKYGPIASMLVAYSDVPNCNKDCIYSGTLTANGLAAGSYMLAFYAPGSDANTYKTAYDSSKQYTPPTPTNPGTNVPLPGSAALLALGLLGLGAARRKTA